jgi:hypothetical protein
MALLLLVVVPIADAATCVGEELSSSMEAGAPGEVLLVVNGGASDAGGHDRQLPGDAEHCIHGHCHHSMPFKDGDRVAHTLSVGSISVMSLGSHMTPTRVPAGLDRPPKA